MVTILPALGQVREDLVKYLDRSTVERLCDELGYGWRDRRLDPYATLRLFILQVLNRNTAMTHLPHLAGERFTASAYCQARQRLPLPFFRKVVDAFTRGLRRVGEVPRWRGHRALLVDGSGFSMPDTPELQAYFGQPGAQRPGCGFPRAHLLTLLDAEAGFLCDVILSPLRPHDMAQLHRRTAVAPTAQAGKALAGVDRQSRTHRPHRTAMHQTQNEAIRPDEPTAPRTT